MTPLYQDIQVGLTGRDGNAFSILGQVKRAMQKAGVSKSEIDRYMTEATAGDYDHLLQVTMKWVVVC